MAYGPRKLNAEFTETFHNPIRNELDPIIASSLTSVKPTLTYSSHLCQSLPNGICQGVFSFNTRIENSIFPPGIEPSITIPKHFEIK